MTFEEAKAYAAAHVGIRPNYPGRLSGKIAIVTGGAQGFGFGIAQELISEGAQVVIANRGEKAGLAAVEKLGDHSAFAQCDVSVPESCRNLMIKAVEIFGGIDIFISNAGVLKAGALPNMTPEDFQAVTNIDYNGYFFCTKYVSEIMKAEYEADKSRFYDIIQINSKSGLVGSKANFAYAGAKFGGIGLTQSFALELVDWNIKVNSVCPGNYYDGPLWSDPEKGLFVQYLAAGKVPGAKTVEDVRAYYLAKSPIHRGCTPKDVSKAIFYCVEQEFETGQAIPVTGGQTMLN